MSLKKHWIFARVEKKAEFRAGSFSPFLVYGKNIFENSKLIQKDFKGDFDRRETPFFPPNFRKDYSEENRALAWEERSGPPRPFPLIWKGMVQNLFVYVCVILEIIKRKTLYLFKPNLPPPLLSGSEIYTANCIWKDLRSTKIDRREMPFPSSKIIWKSNGHWL